MSLGLHCVIHVGLRFPEALKLQVLCLDPPIVSLRGVWLQLLGGGVSQEPHRDAQSPRSTLPGSYKQRVRYSTSLLSTGLSAHRETTCLDDKFCPGPPC